LVTGEERPVEELEKGGPEERAALFVFVAF
jgi:hypothetical protein